MTVWVCSKCGMAGARPSEVRPSLDDRYAVGFCPKCAPPPNRTEIQNVRRPAARPTVALVRSDLWDANGLTRRAEADRLRKLLKDAGNQDEDGNIAGTWKLGQDNKPYARRLTPQQREEAVRRLAELDAEAAARHSA